MKKQANISVDWLIGIMIVIILAIFAANFVSTQHTIHPITNETVSTVNGSWVSLDYVDLVANTFTMINESGGTVGATNYELDILAGKVKINNSDYAFENPTSYNYYPPGYSKAAMPRILIGALVILIIMAAIVIIAKKLEE